MLKKNKVVAKKMISRILKLRNYKKLMHKIK
jgi:hypothetical protein